MLEGEVTGIAPFGLFVNAGGLEGLVHLSEISWDKVSNPSDFYKVGDKVKSDDVIADVETDKATMEVMPYVDGTLLYIGVEKGKAAKVNGIIAIVGKEGEDYSKILAEEAKKEE